MDTTQVIVEVCNINRAGFNLPYFKTEDYVPKKYWKL